MDTLSFIVRLEKMADYATAIDEEWENENYELCLSSIRGLKKELKASVLDEVEKRAKRRMK